ncbi:MAG: 6-carboxytetrahydropterin synthase [Sumerlaeia bacterium]
MTEPESGGRGPVVSVSREIQCDIGHRIPFHKAACANVHGHRYRIVATLEGPVVRADRSSDDGMVTDFGDLKRLMLREIHDVVDHAFMVWEGDTALREFLEGQSYRLLVLDQAPTAENFAEWCFQRLDAALPESFPPSVRLTQVTVWETPNCQATYCPRG